MNKTEKKIINVLAELGNAEQNNVLAFAEFLLSKAQREEQPLIIAEPQAIPRPENERVVAAIKRLSETYPMLKKNSMLDETAALMSAHILQGRDAVSVIDELQELFARRYEQFCHSAKNNDRI